MNNVMTAAKRTIFAAVGAPVVVKDRVLEFGTKMVSTAKDQFTAAADEGERMATTVRKNAVVEEISSRIDLDDIQDRVDKLRDQLEDALANWREGFRPETEAKTAPVKTETAKVTSKPAARKPAARKPAAAKTAAPKTAAAKSSTAKKAPAKKAPAKATTRKPAAKTTAAKSGTAKKTTSTKS